MKKARTYFGGFNTDAILVFAYLSGLYLVRSRPASDHSRHGDRPSSPFLKQGVNGSSR